MHVSDTDADIWPRASLQYSLVFRPLVLVHYSFSPHRSAYPLSPLSTSTSKSPTSIFPPSSLEEENGLFPKVHETKKGKKKKKRPENDVSTQGSDYSQGT